MTHRDKITLEGYTFSETPFDISERNLPSPFLLYNKRTVRELLQKKQYKSLEERIIKSKNYSRYLDLRIDEFLQTLIDNGDEFYRDFLNENGCGKFCRFTLTEPRIQDKLGLYLYTHKGAIVYIGKCTSNFAKRFRAGYGTIAPKNCYKDGQATNTRINSLMNKHGGDVRIYLCILSDTETINKAEKMLIQNLNPKWNRQK